MFAFAPSAVGIMAIERDLDPHVAQLLHESFGFGEMTANFQLTALEQYEESGDEIALGHTPRAVLAGFLCASSDGDGHQAARQVGAAEQVHDRPADTGGVRDQSGAAAELRTANEVADMF